MREGTVTCVCDVELELADVGIMLWGGDSDEMVRLGLGSGVRVADTLIGLESVKSGVGDGAKRVTAGRSGGLAVGVTTTF